jgi:hypothetical protein
MRTFIYGTKREIVNGVNQRFKRKVDEWKKEYMPGRREDIYVEVFQWHLFCETFGIYTSEASEYFNELTVLHIGASVDDINNWSQKLATNNVMRFKDKVVNVEDELTKEQMEIVTKYYKHLFAKVVINEDPFKKD